MFVFALGIYRDIMILARLQSTGSGELALEVILLESLDVRVAANVLLVDEDVGDAALAGHLSESVLDVGTVICTDNRVSGRVPMSWHNRQGDVPIWSSSRA